MPDPIQTNAAATIRKAIRAAKAMMTQRANEYKAAIDAHLKAVRGETRTAPIFLDLDSDKAIDALDRASEAYESSRVNLTWLIETERRIESANRIAAAAAAKAAKQIAR